MTWSKLLQFRDWEHDKGSLPAVAAGVYQILNSGVLVYVGMSGRGASAASLTRLQNAGKRTGLITRLNSHASGRLSGDQFCVYVANRLVLPKLTAIQIQEIGAGKSTLDAHTRDYIRTRLSYQYLVTADGPEAYELEHKLRREKRPLLNPLS